MLKNLQFTAQVCLYREKCILIATVFFSREVDERGLLRILQAPVYLGQLMTSFSIVKVPLKVRSIAYCCWFIFDKVSMYYMGVVYSNSSDVTSSLLLISAGYYNFLCTTVWYIFNQLFSIIFALHHLNRYKIYIIHMYQNVFERKTWAIDITILHTTHYLFSSDSLCHWYDLMSVNCKIFNSTNGIICTSC